MLRAASIRLLLAAGLGLVAAIGAASEGGRFLQRWSIDGLLWLRHQVAGPLDPPGTSPVAIVVIDEETHGTAPFDMLPEVAWTPQTGKVIAGIGDAGAKVVGLDLIYPKTLDPERDSLLPGHDRPLLIALRNLARDGRIVLGQVNASRQVIAPEPRQVRMAGGTDNVKTLQLVTDSDNVVREYMARRADESGEVTTTFAGELAKRAGATTLPETFLINYDTARRPFPIFSFADIFACVDAGRAEFLERAFRGRVVLLGTALDVEDRRIPARQFLDNRYDGPSDRCLPRPPNAPAYGDSADRRTTPGVFIQAAAVETLVRDRPLRMPGTLASAGGVFAWTAASTLAFLTLSPLAGVAALILLLVAALAGSLWAFLHAWVLPAALAVGATLVAAGVVYLVRFIEELRARRRTEQAKKELSNRFGRYLAPHIISQLEHNPDALRLGGERRRITVFFSDIVGYTTVSERLQEAPEKLVEVINAYFTLMVEIVERHGGYVDKFIGDCVMAVWGAPLEQEDQETKAVETALACVAALERFNREVVEGKYGLPHLGARIGVNTGPAIVGNMGSPQRLNYTVTGDTVNLGSRLEGANKAYGTEVMVGPETADAVAEGYVLRQLDLLQVKGKTKPVRVYEVLGRKGEVDAAALERVRRFNAALGLYAERQFEAAHREFTQLAATDPVAKLYAGRARHYLAAPPPVDWDGSFEMTEK